MASFIYDKAREEFLTGALNWTSDTIKVSLVTSGFTATQGAASPVYTDTNTFRVGTDQTLGSKTATSGVADAGDATWTALSGSAVAGLVIWDDTHASDRLIAYIDSITGFPFTPSGADEVVQWDNGANKIFKL